jgi:hypothetical protein
MYNYKYVLTAFKLLPHNIWGRKRGPFFTGVYLPQKLVLSPPIERRYKPFQKHVPSYQVKISESCFVWVAPTLLTARPLHNQALNSLNDSQEVRDSNPASVKAREEVQTRVIFSFNT